MRVADNIEVDWRALVGWNALPGSAREQILDSLMRLTSQPPEQWGNGEVAPLAVPGDVLYTLRGPNDLLVTFRWGAGGQVTILDLVLKETIKRYFAGTS